MDVLHFHPAVDDILSFVVFQAVTIRVTYRIPRDVLTNATEDEEEDIPTSREPDDLDVASFYIRRQTGLGGTIYAELQTLPYTFRVGYRAFCCVPYVRVRAQQFRPVRILLMLATSRWFLRRCFALGYTSPRVDVDQLRRHLTAQDFLDILDGSSHCEIHCSYDVVFQFQCRHDRAATRFYEASPVSPAGSSCSLIDLS